MKTSFPREKLKILLLEAIHPATKKRFEDAGYVAELIKPALTEAELLKQIPDCHVLGIRSKTTLTQKVLEHAKNLLAVGCFCIGTNQVELDAAAIQGIPVFNAPFSNTRSVAELVIAEIIMLARKAAQKSSGLHAGIWDKSATNCFEVRGKTLGIIGYGHIGPQVGILAEAFGMKVQFYDVLTKLALGNSKQLSSLPELLGSSDFVTLHVPETPETKNLIAARELAQMKKGSYLINLARGTVVDIPALAEALKSGHLEGAAVDVFPYEPVSNEERFTSELCGLKNVILTPHIGGSTEEAQHNIGLEVASSLLKFVEQGSTTGSVNFPEVELPVVREGGQRLLNMHKNVPGVMRDINKIIAERGVNIRSQYLSTKGDVGYLIMDMEGDVSKEVKRDLDALSTSIKTRLLF